MEIGFDTGSPSEKGFLLDTYVEGSNGLLDEVFKGGIPGRSVSVSIRDPVHPVTRVVWDTNPSCGTRRKPTLP